MDLTALTPREVDTLLVPVLLEVYRKHQAMGRAAIHLSQIKDGIAKEQAGERRYTGWSSYLPDTQAAFDKARDELRAAQAAQVPFDEEFDRRGGWSRFMLVVSSAGGHLHSSMECSTCNNGKSLTEFALQPEFSGMEEDDAIAHLTEKHSTVLCSVCFPNAPVELFSARQDPSVCTGSGTYVDTDLPNRIGYYSGNWATCPVCSERVTVPGQSGRKLRKHKVAAQ